MRYGGDKIVFHPVEANLPTDRVEGKDPDDQQHQNHQYRRPDIGGNLPPCGLVEDIAVSKEQLRTTFRKSGRKRYRGNGRSALTGFAGNMLSIDIKNTELRIRTRQFSLIAVQRGGESFIGH